MRPKDLKFPFSEKERSVLLNDRVWYIPEILSSGNPVQAHWSHPDVFGNNNPLCIEYCSGNGAWIAERAKAHPMINWVAVEKKFVRARKIWSKVKNLQLNNLLIICGEAHHVTKHYFADTSITDIFINFPDPWPKNRHAKHRLINPSFVSEMMRILQDSKTFTFVTDDIPYSDWLIKVMGAHAGFDSCYPAPFYINELPEYGSSYFNELWKAKGREIRYHRFRKQCNTMGNLSL